MTKAELLRRAKQRLDGLSERHLAAAEDFLAYLQEREEAEATEELLRMPGIMDELRKAEEDIAAGRTVAAEDLKRNE